MYYLGLAAISSFVKPAVALMAILAGLICTFLLVYGGLQYITSSGNAQKLVIAKRTIVRSLLGLVVVIAAFGLSALLTKTYGPVSVPQAHQLPSLHNIQPVASGSGLVDVLLKAISGLMDAVISSASTPFIKGLMYFTNSTPLLTHNGSVVHLWLLSTGIADGLMVLVIALIGFHIMGAEYFGLREVSLRSLAPQLLVVFALINSSIYLLDGIIGLSNAMIKAIRAGTGNLTPWHSLLGIVNQLNGLSLAALFIYVIMLVFVVILLVYYIGRLVVLYVGAVLAPLVLLLWIVPGFKDFAENALKTYLSTIFVLFVHVIILSLAGSLFAGLSGPGGPNTLMALLLGLATLVALIKTQGVMMQLNYASIGPRAARKLGGSFVNGMVYVAAAAQTSLPLAAMSDSVRSYLPQSRPQKVSQYRSKQGAKK